MILCRSISDKSDVNAWIRTGPKAEKLYKGFEPGQNESTGKFEVSVNRCLDYSDFLLSSMAVRATRTEGIKNTPVIIAVAINDNVLQQHGIEKRHTPDHGTTGFAKVDRLHFDLIADQVECFKSLAVDLYTSHLKSGDIVHTLNNGCLLRGCRSLLELADSPDKHAAQRVKQAAEWLTGESDMLDDVEACSMPTLWDTDDPNAVDSSVSVPSKRGWFNRLFGS